MKNLVFVTGNMNKLKQAERFLGRKLQHHKLDLDEIQDLDPARVLEHKVREAYRVLQQPVLVEDASLVFVAMGRLPGTFIKFFHEELGADGLCRLLDAYDDRRANHEVTFGIYDGTQFHSFSAKGHGTIADSPRGSGGFGFDSVFIPDGQSKTRAEMTEEEYAQVHPRSKAAQKLAGFLK